VCDVAVQVEGLALKKRKVQIKKPPLIVTCQSFETGQPHRGSCSAQGVLPELPSPAFSRPLPGAAPKTDSPTIIRPENNGDEARKCPAGMVATDTRTVRFSDKGTATIKLKLNALARQALRKLIEKQPVFLTTCVTVTRPSGSRITVAKPLQLVSPCPGGRPSSVCGFVLSEQRVEP